MSSNSKRAPTDFQYWRSTLIITFLSCISFYTSWDGFSKYMSGEEIAPMVLALVVAVIQLVLVLSLTKLSSRISLTKKLPPLFLYMTSMTLSVFLSFSFYYEFVQASNYANSNFKIQLNNSVLNAESYKDSFNDINQTALELAIYSKEKAKTETEVGNTCGDNSKPGKGPRRELRQTEELLFTSLSNNIMSESKKIDGDIKKLMKISDSFSLKNNNTSQVQLSMNTIIARINKVRTGQNMKRLKEELQPHRGKARERFFVTSLNRTISCPDNKISQSINSFVSYIDELPYIKSVELFDPSNDQEAMERALKVFLSIPTAVKELLLPTANANNNSNLSSEITRNASEINGSDYAPIFLGAAVDIFIFIIGYSHGKKIAQNNYLKENFYGEVFSVKDIIKISKTFNIDNIGEKLRFHAHRKGNKHYYLIPSEAYSEIESSGSLIAVFSSWVANKRISKPFARHIPLDGLPKNIGIKFTELFSQSQQEPTFDFYKLTKDQWSDLEQSINSFNIWKGDT